jgi:hypothetical protein
MRVSGSPLAFPGCKHTPPPRWKRVQMQEPGFAVKCNFRAALLLSSPPLASTVSEEIAPLELRGPRAPITSPTTLFGLENDGTRLPRPPTADGHRRVACVTELAVVGKVALQLGHSMLHLNPPERVSLNRW